MQFGDVSTCAIILGKQESIIERSPSRMNFGEFSNVTWSLTRNDKRTFSACRFGDKSLGLRQATP